MYCTSIVDQVLCAMQRVPCNGTWYLSQSINPQQSLNVQDIYYSAFLESEVLLGTSLSLTQRLQKLLSWKTYLEDSCFDFAQNMIWIFLNMMLSKMWKQSHKHLDAFGFHIVQTVKMVNCIKLEGCKSVCLEILLVRRIQSQCLFWFHSKPDWYF